MQFLINLFGIRRFNVIDMIGITILTDLILTKPVIAIVVWIAFCIGSVALERRVR